MTTEYFVGAVNIGHEDSRTLGNRNVLVTIRQRGRRVAYKIVQKMDGRTVKYGQEKDGMVGAVVLP
jgi:hypothetical protein